MSASRNAPKLSPVYEKKTATEQRDCFICRKDTSTVLRQDGDFFFVCENHLKDVSFCTPVIDPAAASTNASKPSEPAKAVEKDKDAKADPSTTKDNKDQQTVQPEKYKLSSAYHRMREERLIKLQARSTVSRTNLLSQLPAVPKSAPSSR